MGARRPADHAGFEVNELGFQRNADWRILKADWRYRRQTPARLVRRWTVGSDDLGIGWTTTGQPRAREIDAMVKADFRSYWDATVSWRRDLPALSTEWLHGGSALLLPARDTVRVIVNSDTRRRSSVALDGTFSAEPGTRSNAMSLAPQVTWRAGDRIEWTLGPSYSDETVGWQFVSGPDGVTPDYVVGRLRQQTASLLNRADLIFNVRASLQFYLQPFVSTGRYDRLQRLVDPRAARPTSRFAPLPGRTVDTPDGVERSLNATVVFRWEYRPASFLTVVWNRRQDTVAPGRASLAGAIGGFTGTGAADAFLVKTSLRLGR